MEMVVMVAPLWLAQKCIGPATCKREVLIAACHASLINWQSMRSFPDPKGEAATRRRSRIPWGCELVHIERGRSLLLSRALEREGRTMFGTVWNRKQFGFVALILTLACVAAFLSIALVHPTPTANGTLGVGWQCNKTAGMLTVCTRVAHARPTSDSPRNDQPRLRQAGSRRSFSFGRREQPEAIVIS